MESNSLHDSPLRRSERTVATGFSQWRLIVSLIAPKERRKLNCLAQIAFNTSLRHEIESFEIFALQIVVF